MGGLKVFSFCAASSFQRHIPFVVSVPLVFRKTSKKQRKCKFKVKLGRQAFWVFVHCTTFKCVFFLFYCICFTLCKKS